MLHAHETWEKQLSRVERHVYGDDTRMFHCVELPRDLPLFHLDFCTPPTDDQFKLWRTLIFTDVKTLVSFLSENDFAEIRIGFQPRRWNISSESLFRIEPLFEILEMTTDEGGSFYQLKCQEQTYIDGPMGLLEPDPARLVRSIWTASGIER